ncbi:MAG: DNA internalization-related competence protein ComEC/Rec2 [Pseudomonadota bacterium]
MRWISTAFLCGILLLDQFSTIPSWPWLVLALAAGLLFSRYLHMAGLWLALGFCWAAADGAAYLSQLLPEPLERQDLLVEGRVVSLPEERISSTNFLFAIDRSTLVDGVETGFAGVVKLSWHSREMRPLGGERWRLQVRLRQPRGFRNPGGFDYERWLFQQNIVARGYVRQSSDNSRIDENNLTPLVLRQNLSRQIANHAEPSPERAVLNALLIGDRSGLNDSEWQLFRATGTSHLIAISGLHIGLVALMTWMLVTFLWRHAGRLPLWLPSPIAGAWAALIAAASYAMLAGFSIPTQRALVMTAVFSFALILRRNSSSLDAVALALLLVLMLDPRSVLSAGFWLSFMAVIAILLLIRRYPRWGRWKLWMAIQGGLFVALIPVLAFWDFPASPIGPLVNLVAVPWFSFVIVPGVLLTALLLALSIPGADLLLNLLLHGIAATLQAMEFAAMQSDLITLSMPPWWMALLAGIGALLLLLGRRWYWRAAGLPLLLMLIWPRSPSVDNLAVTVLDVGQGQSVVIETANHTLVYDLGPIFPSGFNTAESVVTPWLLSRGRQHIDMLVLSHDDNDHTGGAQQFDERMEVLSTVSGQQMPQYALHSESCHGTGPWQWDGVFFRFLTTPIKPINDNDASCILLLEHSGGRVLITGDVTRRIEQALLKQHGDALHADLVTIPHHGSRTSSSPAFVKQVAAKYSIVSAGWKSRYGLPKADILQRWQESGAQVDNTAAAGAIRIEWDDDGKQRMRRYRDVARRFWHR